MDTVEDSKELEAKPNINKEENIMKKEDDESDNKENKTDIINDDSYQHQKTNNLNISKVVDADNDIKISNPINTNDNTRSQKQSAMNRMRNNVKNTLFVGITKKINPEGTNQNDSTQNNGQQMFSASTFKQDMMNSANQGKFNQSNTISNLQDDQAEQSPDNHHYKNQKMANSTKIDQCPRIEFSFANSNAANNKFRTNDPLLSKLFQDRDQTAQKDSSIINQTRIFEENYELLNDKLGEGCHGDVRKCIHKKEKEIYAVKMIRNGDTEIILSAITSFKIAKNLNHPSVIKPYELFINRETEKIFYVMEYCEYGSLQDYIENLWCLSPHKKDRSINKRRAASVEYFDQDIESQNNLEFQEKSRRKKSLGDHQRINKRKPTQKTENVNDMLIKLQQQTETNEDVNTQDISQSNVKQNPEDIKIGEQDGKNEDSINQKEEDLNQGSKVHRKRVQFTQQTGSKIEYDSVKKILKEILLAVEYLHSEGICHRDLKPDNILVSNDLQQVKIIDFEISKQFKFFRQNRSGVLKICEMWTRTGTQDFMSPEMFESTGYTEAVDTWAIGVIAYFLLTGRLPFDQEYISDKIEYIRNAQYNQEYLKDVDEIPKDFIRRMLKKDPNERLTATEALSHPWFLVSSESRNRIDTLNKSTVLNMFHSPQDNDKFSNQESALHKDMNFKGNQSTYLGKRDTSGIESMLYHTNTQYLNKGNLNKNSQGNYSLSSKNSSKGRGSKVISEFDGKGDLNQNLESNEVNQMSESSKIISEIKRSNRSHATYATEVGKSPQSGNKTSKRREINGNNQIIKQSFFYDENNQVAKNLGDSSCRGLKNPQNKSINSNISNFRESSHEYGNTSKNEKLDQLICGDQEESEGEESEKDDSQLKRKKEFKMRIQQFKEQMCSGMSDIFSTKFIHINQKQVKHPQVSQLRLRLLQEKNLQRTNSSDKNSINQINMQNVNENKGEFSKPQGINSSNHNLSNTNINGSITLNGIINSINNLNQQSQSSQNMSTSNQLHFNFNTHNGFLQGVSSGSSHNIPNQNSVNSSNYNIANNIQNTTSNSSINLSLINYNSLQISQFPFEQSKLSLTPQQNQHSQQLINPQLFLDMNHTDLLNLRSRSNTNDLVDKNESEDQIETRAKRLSEDFTSSCIIYNPSRQQQIQNIMQQNLHSSLKNGSLYDGRVQKQSHFSSNQYTLFSNNSISNPMQSQTNINMNSSKQLTFQEQLQLKPTKFVRDFLLSTGSLKERDEIDEQPKKDSLETSVNPIFKRIDSDEETPTNDQADLVFKRVMSSNSSNTENIVVCRQYKSSSDVCSIASEIQINIDQNLQQDQIKNDQNIPSSQIIQSSSEESFQVDDDDDDI